MDITVVRLGGMKGEVGILKAFCLKGILKQIKMPCDAPEIFFIEMLENALKFCTKFCQKNDVAKFQ